MCESAEGFDPDFEMLTMSMRTTKIKAVSKVLAAVHNTSTLGICSCEAYFTMAKKGLGSKELAGRKYDEFIAKITSGLPIVESA